MIKYRCWYLFGYVRKYVVVDRLDFVKDGFWINKDEEYAAASDVSIWIPPAKILYVAKVVNDE